MKWVGFLCATVVIIFIVRYEWPRMNKHPKKDKFAFFIVTAIAWGVAFFYNFFPGVPGPDDWINTIFRPLGQWLENSTYQKPV